MLKITAIKQNRLFRGAIGEIRVWITERRRSLSSCKPSETRAPKDVAKVCDDGHEWSETEEGERGGRQRLGSVKKRRGRAGEDGGERLFGGSEHRPTQEATSHAGQNPNP